MPEQDTTDFVAAFAIGAALGTAAVLLLRPSARSRTVRVARGVKVRWRPPGKGARRLQTRVPETAAGATTMREEVAAAGRSAARRFRGEVADAVDAAREEIARTLEERVADAKERLERSADRLRRP